MRTCRPRLSGWRPTVVVAGSAGYGDGLSRSYSALLQGWEKLPTERDIGTAQATVTQPIYTGGRTQANVNRAKDQVMAERANLIAQEQTSFTNTVNAYVGVIENQELLALNINNEQVLAKQLDATNDRFRVGEITRTDVAQAEAALAGATAQRETAEGNLATARATYRAGGRLRGAGESWWSRSRSICGCAPKQTPRPWRAANNPNVVSAEFNDSAAKDAVDVAFSQLLPQLSLQAQTFEEQNAGARSAEINGYQVVRRSRCRCTRAARNTPRCARRSRPSNNTAQLVADAQAHCGAGGGERLGDAGGGDRRGGQHSLADPRQRGGAGRRGARGDRRVAHHAGRAERAAGAAELAGDAGAEPGAAYHRVVWRRRRRSGG